MNESLLRLLQENWTSEETPRDPKLDRRKFSKAPFAMAGSKAMSLEHIIPRLPIRNKFVDVFGGSGVISINVKPAKLLNVYNDRNSGAVNFFRVLRTKDGRNKLIEFYNNAVISREDFIICKDTWKSEADDFDRACKWLYMIKCSVLGRGKSFARQTDSHFSKLMPSEALFRRLHRWAQNFCFENLDFRLAIKDYASDDCVFYCDPPYLGTDVQTYQSHWTQQDQIDLLNLIHDSPGFFALSGFPLALNDRYSWDEKYSWSIRKAANIQGRRFYGAGVEGTSTEVLWIKH